MSAGDPLWVGLDGRNLALAQGTGVATYARSLARVLSGLGLRREVLTDRAPGADALGDYGGRRSGLARLGTWLRALPPGDRATRVTTAPETCAGFERARWAPDLFRTAQVHFDLYGRPLGLTGAMAPDLMHWTYPLPLLFRGIPNIVTIHDVIPLSDPGMSDIPPARYRRLLGRLVAAADHVVTVSEASRRAILAALGCPPAKVTNTYQAVEPPGPQAEAPVLPQLPAGSYFLFIGTIERRKNVGRLVEAYRASGVRAPLLLIGRPGWRAAEELPEARGGSVAAAAIRPGEPAVVPLGRLPEGQMLSLLRRARALLFPSLAEGFGLPIVEAMSLGVPVMTARGGATGEIAGEAALLVDPLDIRDMAAGIAALDGEPALRAQLARDGRLRAACFAPGRFAERLLAVYRGLPAPGSLWRTLPSG